MKRFILVTFSIFIGILASAQGFPKSEKQPRMKEQKANHRKYARSARRRHVKRGTAYMPGNLPVNQPIPNGMLADDRRYFKNII